MAGERGLDGNLGRLAIADLPHHDLVRIVPEDRAKPAGERQAFFLVHRDLDDAVELVLHGVFDRDDLDVFGVDLGHRRIECRRLAATGRASDKDHAVRFGDRPPEAAQVGGVQAEPVEPQFTDAGRNVILVEDAENHVLAERARQDRHAEIHGLLVHPDPEPPVLRHPPLRDVQFGHDLEPRNQRRMELEVQGIERRGQNPVHAELDVDRMVGGFDMDVADTLLERVQQDRIHQTHHGALVFCDLLDREHFLALVVLPHQQRSVLGLDFLERLTRPLAPAERGKDCGARADRKLQRPLQQHLEFVQRRKVVGVGHGDDQHLIAFAQRHERMAVHQLHGDRPVKPRVHAKISERLVRQTILRRQDTRQLLLGHQALRHQRLADDRRKTVLRAERQFRVLAEQRRLIHQQIVFCRIRLHQILLAHPTPLRECLYLTPLRECRISGRFANAFISRRFANAFR